MSGSQLGQYIRANVNLQAGKFVFQLAHFLYISVHHLLVVVPLFVDLLNDKERIAIYK
jgi:hypothetical protein